MKYLLVILMVLLSACATVQEEREVSISATPIFHIFGATWCSHCRIEIPELLKGVENSNIQTIIHVNDKRKFPFDESIEQDITGELTYKMLTGRPCTLVPSWVVTDSTEVVDASCGPEKSEDDLISALEQISGQRLNIAFSGGNCDLNSSTFCDQSVKTANKNVLLGDRQVNDQPWDSIENYNSDINYNCTL